MASLFNITTATSSITLDAQRTGKASFTVSNTSTNTVRANAHITSDDKSIQPWFTIDGESRRVLTPAETTQYTVRIAVPLTAVPKDYTFTLLVVDESNPDENYTEGPAVKFVVPESGPRPPTVTVKKGYLIAVAGAVVGGLVGTTLGLIVAALIGNADVGFARIVGSAIYAILTGLGSWMALNTGECDWGRETALVLGAINLVGAIIALNVLTNTSNQSVVLACIVVFLMGLVIPALIARAIILQWKTGHV